jgi:hypothetical protein
MWLITSTDRWRDAVGELLDLQDAYRAWLDSLPPNAAPLPTTSRQCDERLKVYHLRFATCWQPRVKGLQMMVNSVFKGWRFEDVWFDQ